MLTSSLIGAAELMLTAYGISDPESSAQRLLTALLQRGQGDADLVD